jgi:hypothetical protein
MMSDDEDALGDRFDEHIRDLIGYVINASMSPSREDQVAAALLCLLVRVANSWRSIRTLRTHTPDADGFAVDAGAILRAMFDAYLQAEYIVSDQEQSHSRASLYFDFEHVEKYKHMQKWMEHNNSMTERLKKSPHRPAGERNVREQYDRVKDRFLVEKRQKDGTIKRGPATRNQWFSGDLRTIAKGLGKLDEYDLLLASLHGCVHSSVRALKVGPPVSGDHVLFWATTVVARIINLNVRYNNIPLSELNANLIGRLNAPYFGGEIANDATDETSPEV